MSNEANLKRTPLYECHQESGAKFTEFGGWDMPVQYSGLVDEHLAVRQAAGLFDVSHMGEITVKGPDAESWLQYVTCNDVSKLVPGKAQYSMLLNEAGGVVDDIIVYKLAEEDFLLCVNASNSDKDEAWLREQLDSQDLQLENVSKDYGQIALQGPKAEEILCKLYPRDDADCSRKNLKPFWLLQTELAASGCSAECLIARTGYTGEDGFEIFCPSDFSAALWRECLKVGEPIGLKPAGLGARDTLRLEACYPLHGHEISDELSPLAAGLSWVVKLGKGDFIGKSALEEQKQKGLSPLLVGVEVTGRGIVREETPLFDGDKRVGWVTSGTKPPTVNKPVGMAYLESSHSSEGTELEAEVRGRRFSVKVIPLPFYKRT